jgi:multidrug efflux system membrane fusion protein
MKTRLLATSVLVPLLMACSRTEPAPEPVRSVKLITAQQSPDASAQGWAAEVRARYEARLSFRIGGLLTLRHVELGQRFKAGQVLVELDPQDPGLASQAAQAQVLAAQSQRDLTLADLRRYEALFKQGFIGQAELERRQSAAQTAQAQLDQARAQNDLQANQTRYTRLTASQSGIVTGIEAEPGQVVAAGAPVLRVAWDGPREVQAWVAEDQVGQWRAGQTVQVARWSDTQPVRARVREVAASADPQTRSFLIRIDLPAQLDWALGQTARVWAQGLQGGSKALALPTAALLHMQGQSGVWVFDSDKKTVRFQPVQVLGYQADQVLVGQGIEAGQQVVAAGGHVLTDGQTVTPYVPKKPPPQTTADPVRGQP